MHAQCMFRQNTEIAYYAITIPQRTVNKESIWLSHFNSCFEILFQVFSPISLHFYTLKHLSLSQSAEFGVKCRVRGKMPSLGQSAEFGAKCRVWGKVPSLGQTPFSSHFCRFCGLPFIIVTRALALCLVKDSPSFHPVRVSWMQSGNRHRFDRF
jgi:hypothetical protein